MRSFEGGEGTRETEEETVGVSSFFPYLPSRKRRKEMARTTRRWSLGDFSINPFF